MRQHGIWGCGTRAQGGGEIEWWRVGFGNVVCSLGKNEERALRKSVVYLLRKTISFEREYVLARKGGLTTKKWGAPLEYWMGILRDDIVNK